MHNVVLSPSSSASSACIAPLVTSGKSLVPGEVSAEEMHSVYGILCRLLATSLCKMAAGGDKQGRRGSDGKGGVAA